MALVEPLHDFKNMINRVINELPFMTKDDELRKQLDDIVSIVRGP